MQVCYVTMQFPARSETFAVRDIVAMRRAGADVTVLTLRGRPGRDTLPLDRRLPSDVKIIRSTFRRFIRRVLSGGPSLWKTMSVLWQILVDKQTSIKERLKCLVLLPTAWILSSEILRQKPDVIHIFWGHYPALVTLLTRDSLPDTRFSLFLGAYDLNRKLGVSREASNRSDVIFTHAEANVGAIRLLTGTEKPVRVVYRGIDLTDYPPLEEVERRKQRKQFFTAGRLLPAKGFDKVLHLFALILERLPDAKLRLAGDGPERNKLEQLAESLGISHRVDFTGWLSEDQIREEMVAAQFFLLFSTKRGECLPNVVKEAMAAACICVVSRSAGIDELVTHGRNGYVVEPGQMTTALELVLRHSEGLNMKEATLGKMNNEVTKLEKIQLEACRQIRETFDVTVSADKYLSEWQRISPSTNSADPAGAETKYSRA